MQYKSEGRIETVEPDSPAARAGVVPGDRLVAINGQPIRDVVGYQFQAAAERLTVEVQRGGQPVLLRVRKAIDQDLGLRRRLLGNPRAPEILPQLHRLADMGIQVHTQLVLCPGLNDGAALDQSIGELAELWPAVRSVSGVPVGLTRHRKRWLDAALRS